MPASGARRASSPARLPIHAHDTPRSRSAAATASPGEVCPPVPPPAMTITVLFGVGAPAQGSGARRSGDRRAWPRLRRPTVGRSPARPCISVAFEGETDQALDERAVRQAGGFPQARVRAGRREPGDGVDLVQDDAIALDE